MIIRDSEEAFLEIQKINKHFPGRENPILKSVSLNLQEGEVAGLVGGSGSGKTTLLRIIAGLEEAGEGAVYFRNQKVAGPAETLVAGHPDIRLVHQHFELAHRLPVFDNVSQKLRHLPREEQREQTLDLLRVCRLAHISDKYVEELSGGEKQRLAIARALAEEPELLLLDEPFSNLDPLLKEDLRHDLFAYIRQRGLAAILVSHDPKDALSLADKIWVLQEGQLVQTGPPQEVYYKAVSPQVAALFGQINSLKWKELKSILKEKDIKRISHAGPDSIIGFRPELISVAKTPADVDLLASVEAVKFEGAFYEVKVSIKNQLSLILLVSPFFIYQIGDEIGLKLEWDYVQIW